MFDSTPKTKAWGCTVRSDRSCSDVSVAALIGNAFRDSADRKTHVTIARAGARFS